MEEFNREFDHNLIWVPWQRPGFELAMMLKRAVERIPDATALCWAGTACLPGARRSASAIVNTITIIDQLGSSSPGTGRRKGRFASAARRSSRGPIARELALEILPFLRGRVSAQRNWIANFSDDEDVLRFVNSTHGKDLAFLGTSCPDHFIRTKIRPMFVPWAESEDVPTLKKHIEESLAEYREHYREYYNTHALPDSPALRDANPTIVLIPGLGMFSFGKNKTEARITGEFYTNAIHVMEGASLLSEDEEVGGSKQAWFRSAARAWIPTTLQGVHQLRGHAAERGVPHRVLGAGRGQDSPPARGKRTEPQHCAGGRRRKRHRPRSGACWPRRAART